MKKLTETAGYADLLAAKTALGAANVANGLNHPATKAALDDYHAKLDICRAEMGLGKSRELD